MHVDVERKVLESLMVLATVIEARDPYTGGHAWRVARYSQMLAEDAGCSSDEAFVATIGGLVHDIGKVGVPDSVLLKPGKLDEDEFKAMREHPSIGSEVVRPHPLADLVLDTVAGHHQRPDGSGYPARDSKVSVFAAIVGIADAFDAMTSDRPYRKGMPMEKAAAVVEEGSGTQFDSGLAARFVRMARDGRFAHVLGHANDSRAMLSCPVCGLVIAPPSSAGDGAKVACPVCTGDYVLHRRGDGFEPEWAGSMRGVRVPGPDMDAVNSILARAPRGISF